MTNTETARVNVKATGSVSATTYEVGEIEKLSILSYVKSRETYTWNLALYNIDGTKLDTTMYAGIGYYTEGGMWQIPTFFELVVGEGYSVTTKDWLVVDADGNVTDQTGGEERTFTTGESLFLSTSGASVTYTLESTYVIFQNGVSAAQSEIGKGGTFTVRSPLMVKKAPTISITDNAKTTQTLTLVDENMDGFCELSVTLMWFFLKPCSKYLNYLMSLCF